MTTHTQYESSNYKQPTRGSATVGSLTSQSNNQAACYKWTHFLERQKQQKIDTVFKLINFN